MAVLLFGSTEELRQYLNDNTVYTRHGDLFLSNLQYIDFGSMHIVFTSRASYEEWRDGEVQYQLF